MRRGNHRVAKWAALAGLALALGSLAEANTTYTYTGKPFTTFLNNTGGTNPYSTSDFIQVTLTTASSLPAGLSFPTVLTPVGSPPAPETLPVEVSLQMTDGVDPMGTVSAILVGTDANGAINQWEILSATITPGNVLQTVFGTTYVSANGTQPAVGLDLAARCSSTDAGCANFANDPQVAIGYNLTTTGNTVGTWSGVIQPTVQVSPSPAVLGQPLTVSVTIPGTPPPTGSVQLQVNGNSYGNPIALVNGAATIRIPDPTNNIPDPSLILPITALDSSGNLIGVVYSGEAGVFSPVTQTVNLTVLPTIAVTPNPVYGQPVTFTSMVYNPMAPSPSITSVVFTWDDFAQSLPVNISNGQAQFTLNGQAQYTPNPPSQFPITVGTHYVQATVYQSEVVFQFSNTPNFTISKANTATGLTLSQSGSNATLMATVGVVAPGAGTPTGTISFVSGTKVLANAPLSGGVAMFSASSLSGTVTATYSGDGNFNGSTSSAVTVNPPPPPPPPPQATASVSVSSSLNPSELGQAVTFTASLTVSGSTATPGGSVQFLDGTTSLGSATLAGGSASVTASSLAVGSHAIAAQYSGDGVFPAASASLGQVVNRIASTLTLSVSPAQVSTGQSITISAQVGPAPAGGIPAATGQVTFSAGGNSLGSAAISGGSASISTSNLAAGMVQISASYGGDKNYAGSSATTGLNVLAGPLQITTTSLPNGALNQPYTASVAATGGTPPYKFTIGGLPPGLTGNTTGAISGTPTSGGNFNVTVQVTDNAAGSASAPLTLNISGLTISATLPDSKQGASYSGSASVSGGTPPYKLVITGLPTGLTASVSGASATVSGQPTTAGSFTVTVQASDSSGASASQPFKVNIAATSLTLGAGSPVGGMAGQPYSQCVAVTGGTPPFTFSATLPTGLSIDPATGCISGTPSVGGPVPITVTVTDNTGAKTNVTFTVNFALPNLSAVNFTGLSNSADPRTQPGFGVAITGPYPVDVQGTLTLTFQPATGADTGEVTFSTGTRTLTFTIPANSTAAVFANPSAALQTGTVAGSITITASFNASGTDITPAPAPTKQIQVNAGPPVIVSATASRTSSGFTVSITGYTSTREMSQAMFVFNPASGANLQTTSLTLSVGSVFSAWLQGSQVIGSQFLFTQPFTVTGNLQAVASITITLVNTQGSSQPVTATVQ